MNKNSKQGVSEMLSNSLSNPMTLGGNPTNIMKHGFVASSNNNNNSINQKTKNSSGMAFQIEDPCVDPNVVDRLQLAFILNFCVKHKQRFKLPQLRLQDLYKNVLSDSEGLAFMDIIARLLRYRNSPSVLSLIDIESKIENVDSCLDAYVNQKRSTHRQNILKNLDQNYLVKLDIEKRSLILYDLILCLLDEVPELSYSKSGDGEQQWSNDESASLIIKAGKDSNGCNYYYMDDLRLYRERLPNSAAGLPEWSLAVGASIEQWKSFIASLSGYSVTSEEADLRSFLQQDLFALVSECILNNTWPTDSHENDELSCVAIKAKEFRELNDLRGRLSGPQSAANTPKSVPNSSNNSLSREPSINNQQDSGNVHTAPILTPNSSLTPNSNQSHSGDIANGEMNQDDQCNDLIANNDKGAKNSAQTVSTWTPTSQPSQSQQQQNSSSTPLPQHPDPSKTPTNTSAPYDSHFAYQQSSSVGPSSHQKPALVFTTQMANELAMERQKGSQISVSMFHKMHPLVKDYMASYGGNLTMEQMEKRRSKMAQLEKIHNSLSKQQIQSSTSSSSGPIVTTPGVTPPVSTATGNNFVSPHPGQQINLPNASQMNRDNSFQPNPNNYNSLAYPSDLNGGPMYNSGPKPRPPSNHFPPQQMISKPVNNQMAPISSTSSSAYPGNGMQPGQMMSNGNAPMYLPQQQGPKGLYGHPGSNMPSRLGGGQQIDYFNSTSGMAGPGPNGGDFSQMNNNYMRQNNGLSSSIYPPSSSQYPTFANDPTGPVSSANHGGSQIPPFMTNPRGNGPLMVEGGNNNPAQQEWDQLLMEHNRGKSGSISGAGAKRPSSSNAQLMGPGMPGQHLNDANAPWNQNHMGIMPRHSMMRQNPSSMMSNGGHYSQMMMLPGQYPPSKQQMMNSVNSSRLMMNMPPQNHMLSPPNTGPPPPSAPPTTTKKKKSTKSKQSAQQKQLQLQQQQQQQQMNQQIPPNVMMMNQGQPGNNPYDHHPHTFSTNNNNVPPPPSYMNKGPMQQLPPGPHHHQQQQQGGSNITSASLASLQRLSQFSGTSNTTQPPGDFSNHNSSGPPPFYNPNPPASYSNNLGPQPPSQQAYGNTNVHVAPKTPHTIKYMPAKVQPPSANSRPSDEYI